MMLAGAAELALVRGKVTSPYWRLATPFAFVVSGLAFLIHEQNGWFFQRSSFLHHLMGWTLVLGAVLPLGRAVRPRAALWQGGFALFFVAVAVMLYCDRDVAPILGHLSELAGTPHR
jgi:hypothetical protein